jgi:hypothetical protein
MDEEGLYLINFARSVVSSFVDNLCQPKRIFSTTNIINISENKLMISHLFEGIKKLGTYNY